MATFRGPVKYFLKKVAKNVQKKERLKNLIKRDREERHRMANYAQRARREREI